jgi:hypothetical protein
MTRRTPRTSSACLFAIRQILLAIGPATISVDYLASVAQAQTVAWEARWDGGLVDSNAEAWDVVTGPTGAVYATGIIGNGSGRDIVTLAWSGSGELLWHRLKSGLLDTDDTPAQLTVDNGGRIVVAGTSTRGSSDSLIVVVYDAAGNELWSRLHSISTSRWNRAQGVATDQNGRIVVVGEVGAGSIKRTLLVAFDSLGNLLWERERDLDPYIRAVAMEPTGVLAVGGAPNGLAHGDFLTVAFDDAGSELWARIRDGASGGTDTVRAMVVDSSGRFVVTGTSESAFSNSDFMSVAYDVAGTEIWAATTGGLDDERPLAISADFAGNVAVVGTTVTSSGSRSLTVSYDADGAERWTSTRVEGAGEQSYARDVTTTASGNVVVVGVHQDALTFDGHAMTIQYDGATGGVDWEVIRGPATGFPDAGFAISAGLDDGLFLVGRVEVGSSLNFRTDVLVAKYDSTGTEQWIRKEPEIPAEDIPGSWAGRRGNKSLAAGYDGRVYITGTSFDGVTYDYLTVAYDGFGHEVWEARKSNPDQYPARPTAIVVDPVLGNVYVTGMTFGTGGSGYLTVAYNRDGAEIWSRTRLLDSLGSKFPCCIAADAGGLVFVTGTTEMGEGGGAGDILTIAYDRSGNEVWADAGGLGPFTGDIAYGMTLGSTGILYVAGTSVDPQGGPAKTVTLAYDASGNRLWAETHDVAQGSSAWFTELAPTPDGGVAATGETFGTGFEDILTVAYRPDGSERWSAIADSVEGGLDFASAIAVDAVGRTYVTGSTWNPDYSDPDFLTVAYSDSGAFLWMQEFAGPSGGEDLAGSLAIGSQGTLFVTGRSSNGANSDFLTMAYSPGGYELFQHRYDAGSEDEGYLTMSGPDGSAFIGGVSNDADRDFFLFKLLDESRLFTDGFGTGDSSAWSDTAP